ncbi:MAG: hypothetical protein ABIV94_04525, partial [Acidimicrobiales bacterium]
LPLRAPGNHTLCAYGINDGPGYNYSIGCTTVGVRADPFGSLDIAVAGPRLAYVAGWAIEPEMSGAVEVDVSVDGTYAGHRFASVTRSDIGNDYPAWGGWHGFGFTVPMLPGTHNVCATAINQGYGTHTVIGCRSVTLGTDPIGYIDYAAVNPSSNVATIAGWAIEPEMSGAIEVDVSLDGSYAALGWASQTRSDIANLYGFYGGWHGFSINVTVPPGTHTLCATAINQGWGSSTRLGCRSVVVP